MSAERIKARSVGRVNACRRDVADLAGAEVLNEHLSRALKAFTRPAGIAAVGTNLRGRSTINGASARSRGSDGGQLVDLDELRGRGVDCWTHGPIAAIRVMRGVHARSCIASGGHDVHLQSPKRRRKSPVMRETATGTSSLVDVRGRAEAWTCRSDCPWCRRSRAAGMAPKIGCLSTKAQCR